VTLWEALSFGSRPYQVKCVYVCVCVFVQAHYFCGGHAHTLEGKLCISIICNCLLKTSPCFH